MKYALLLIASIFWISVGVAQVDIICVDLEAVVKSMPESVYWEGYRVELAEKCQANMEALGKEIDDLIVKYNSTCGAGPNYYELINQQWLSLIDSIRAIRNNFIEMDSLIRLHIKELTIQRVKEYAKNHKYIGAIDKKDLLYFEKLNDKTGEVIDFIQRRYDKFNVNLKWVNNLYYYLQHYNLDDTIPKIPKISEFKVWLIR